jgi:endonuclease G
MKGILFACLFCLSWVGWCQDYDTIIDRGIYKSYFSYQLQEPMFVTYILYQGGGDCDRDKFKFKNDTELSMADNEEYTHSGYDRGHLANAEDFANNCTYDELTFRYYNCLPQTPNLNRGAWKTWETAIRSESQTDSLLIICGGIWETNQKVNEMLIPDYCWKVVYNMHTKAIMHVTMCNNAMEESICNEMKLEELEMRLGYKVGLDW